MATIMAGIKSSTSKHNKPGGRAKANFSVSTKKRSGNKGGFGKQKNSKNVKSINTGGNFGPLGY